MPGNRVNEVIFVCFLFIDHFFLSKFFDHASSQVMNKIWPFSFLKFLFIEVCILGKSGMLVGREGKRRGLQL